jgi:hypothetical protein
LQVDSSAAPTVVEYLPLPHSEHPSAELTAPVFMPWNPGSQPLQLSELTLPICSLYFPLEHSLQEFGEVFATSSRYFPALQSPQPAAMFAPASALPYFPVGHSKQSM